MTFTDETLMAFADGEVDQATRNAIDEAMRHDHELAARVARHRALRADIFGAFAPVLEEPVPNRLLAALRPPRADVAAMAAQGVVKAVGARAEKDAANDAGGWSWRQWGGLAAMLLVGIMVGRLSLEQPSAGQQMAAVDSKSGTLTAQGELAAALSQRQAGAVEGAVKIGVSFVANDGNYCRSFALQGRTDGMAGLACKSGAQWQIPVLTQSETPKSDYRTAAVETPGAVLDAIDKRISGKTLDAEQEQEALRQGWQRAAGGSKGKAQSQTP